MLSANLQAVVENNIIFVGKNVLNKSLKPKVSKTYRLNQVNAASVADFLSTLGAQISKVMLLSGSIEGSEIGDGLINKGNLKMNLKIHMELKVAHYLEWLALRFKVANNNIDRIERSNENCRKIY